MDAPRAARYLEKTAHARRRLGQVKAWLANARKSEQATLGTFKAFQEAVEAASDIAAMACVDSGRAAQDDYSNFSHCADLGVVSRAHVPGLEEATGLRNRLVHEYDGVDAHRAFEGIERLSPVLEAFLAEVERWLSTMK